MAASAITPIEFLAGELTEEMADANADGNFVNNYTGKQWLEFQNDGMAAKTITFNSIVLSDYGTDVNKAVTVAAGDRAKVKLVAPPTRWRDANGALQMTYDDADDLKVAAYKWPE